MVDGKTVAALDYPDALQEDPDIETVVGKYAYGFDLGGPDANKFVEIPRDAREGRQSRRSSGARSDVPRIFSKHRRGMPYLEGQAWQSGYADGAPAWAMQISGADLNKDGPVTITLDRALSHLERDAVGGAFSSDVSYVLGFQPALAQRAERRDQGWGSADQIRRPVFGRFFAVLLADRPGRKCTCACRSDAGAANLVGYWGGYTELAQMVVHVHVPLCNTVADCVGTYRSLQKLADADPDPVTGKNRMISTTWRMEAVPVFLASEGGKILATATNDGLGGKVHETTVASTADTAH